MTCLVVLELPGNKRVSISYLDEDFKLVDGIWDKSDSVLLDLQKNGHFKANKWNELTIDEWHILLVFALQKYIRNMKTNSNDFNVIMTGFITFLNLTNKQTINYVHIHNKSEDEFLIQTNSLINLKAMYGTIPKLKLVVDNGH